MKNLLSCKGDSMKFIILILTMFIGALGLFLSDNIMDSEQYYLIKFAEGLSIFSVFILGISIILLTARTVYVGLPILIPAIFKFLDYILH